ncbi:MULTISPECIES: hypothetical protein [unclassified Haloferax]|uniref:hypothetical protein n=1 Tax=Haloferax TaxID=2251 RepID=UPI0002B07010|nr:MULTISPECIES: hypothetical protein [unclassified Haloferax]ELZ60739.1 hypothetical protein C460_02974 [Haloferax sp. ATCC BAA-646]ELZ65518.1 hypothetical protein C459_05971 [Haloferax sp. ATCC BAA-645]ELZ69012.1 hypothetical protein C458_07531 [Haloferax sp. ATCC BAA-644]
MSEQPSNTEPSLGLVVQTSFVLAVVIGIPSAFALGGRLRSLALAAVGTLLLAGFLVVGYRHARRRKSLHQHVAFLVVWFGGIVLADRLARVASGRLPEPGPYLMAVGVTLGALWLGSRLAYGGALTKALFGSD